MEALRKEPHRHPVQTHETLPDRDNLVQGAFWMVGITLLLFFLPAINGLIGGYVGGYKVGTLKRGLLAAVIPALVAGVGLWGIFAALDHPVAGFIAGATTGIVIALTEIGMFIGAAIGGKVAEKRGLPA